MPKLTLSFSDKFTDERWAALTYALEAPYHRGGEWVLGRSPTADLTFASRTVSRRHALIAYSYAADRWTLSDMGSQNGTFYNSEKLLPGKLVELKIRDRLSLGSSGRIEVVENDQDTISPDDTGPSTVGSTTPLATLPTAPATAPAPTPRTQWDSLYMAVEWLMSGNTLADRAYRLVVFAGLTALAVWLLSLFM